MSDDAWLPTEVGLPDRRISPGYEDFGLIGRNAALEDLAKQLDHGADQIALTAPAGAQSTAAERAVTMYGHGGIGKTALAIEFCHLHRERYPLIWWVNADSVATTTESFRSLLYRAGIKDPDELHLRDEVREVLLGVDGWLAVFDNAEDRATFDRWNPRADNGQILITSRSTVGWSKQLEVGLIDPKDAHQWLLRAAGNPTAPAEIAAAEALVERLDGLALALTMATSAIATSSLSRYLAWFDDDAYTVLGEAPTNDPNYDKTVYTALAIARDRLRATNAEAAVTLLEYSAFYAPDQIPMQLFIRDPSCIGATSEAQVFQARDALAELSMIRVDDDKDFFSVHRLTQAVTRYYLDHPSPADEASTATDETDPPPQSSGTPSPTESAPPVHKILLLTANTSTEENAVAIEAREIRDILITTEHRDRFELVTHQAATIEDLVFAVDDHQPTIVQFSGHGSSSGIEFQGPAGPQVVSGERLRHFFNGKGIQLVVLNSRYSADQAHALVEVVPSIVATPAEIDNTARTSFSKALYRSIGNGRTVAEAKTSGQDLVNLHDLDDQFLVLGDEDLRLAPTNSPSTTSAGPRNVTGAPTHQADPSPTTQPIRTATHPTEPEPAERVGVWEWVNRIGAIGSATGIIAVFAAIAALLAYFGFNPFNDDDTPPPAGPATAQSTSDCIALTQDLDRIDFAGADLGNCEPQGTSLANLDLTNTDAQGLVITEGQHDNVDFTGANLRGAQLSGSDFIDARFDEADLTDAHIHSANLSGASFDGANLTDAQIYSIECRDGPINWGQPTGTPQRLDTPAACGQPPSP